jgi:DNA-binding transcriptional ArsR family regulator
MPEYKEIKDTQTLLALAHPVRIRLLEELMVSAPATATQLGQRLGESPANCSWHLRQLARYGFVEEAGGGVGRERPWQVVPKVRTWGRQDADDEFNAAGDAASELILELEVAALRRWERRRRSEPPAWRAAAFVTHGFIWLTVDELAELRERIEGLVTRYVDRIDRDHSPDGARPVRMTAWGVPALRGKAERDA